MKFDPKKHHRRSIRLQGYDYTQRGAYYITIVAHQREHLFGEVFNGEMKLGRFGLVAKEQWERLPRRFKHVELPQFVIMPNHVHGIIMIIEERRGTAEDSLNPDPEMSRRAPTDASKERFGKPVRGSIPTIIRSYKSAVALRINLMRGTAGMEVWQRNYYEHVIRDMDDANRIYMYIESNPANWENDDENPSHPK
jgi:REP element-mobilizing transposase RayT